MSYHYGYEKLYYAVRDNDVSLVEDALFFLGKERIRYNTLCRNKTATEIACENGNIEVLELLLHELPDTDEERRAEAEHLFRLACENEQEESAKFLVEEMGLDVPEFTDEEILSYIAQGQVTIPLLALGDSVKDELLVRILDAILFNGNCIEHVGAAIRSRPKYDEWLRDLTPIHRAVLFRDIEAFDSEIARLGYRWIEQKERRYSVALGYEFGKKLRTVFVDAIEMDVFQLISKIGDVNLLRYALYHAENCGADVKKIAERCCNAAVERGTVSVIHYLFKFNYIHKHYSAQWKWRLEQAVEFKRVQVTMLIIDKFYDEIKPEREIMVTILKWLVKSYQPDDFMPFMDYYCDNFDEINKRNGKKDVSITKDMIECVGVETLQFMVSIIEDKAEQSAKSLFLSFGENVSVREMLVEGFVFDLVDVGRPLELSDNSYYFQRIYSFPLYWSSTDRNRKSIWGTIEELQSSSRHTRRLLDLYSSSGRVQVHEPFKVDENCQLFDIFDAFRYLSGCTLRWESLRRLLESKLKSELRSIVMQKLFVYAVQIRGFNGNSFTRTGNGSYSADIVANFPTLKQLTRRVIRCCARESSETKSHQDRVLELHKLLPRRLIDYLLFRHEPVEEWYRLTYLTAESTFQPPPMLIEDYIDLSSFDILDELSDDSEDDFDLYI